MARALGGYALAVVRAADALTVARAVVAAPVGMMILLGHDRAASLAFAVGGFSDLLDGPIARRSGGTALGHQLDPLADKLLTDVTLLALAARGRVPWAIVAFVIGRDMVVSTLRVTAGDALGPTAPARWKTGLFYVSITGLLAAPLGSITARAARFGLAAAVGLAAVSGWDYVRRR